MPRFLFGGLIIGLIVLGFGAFSWIDANNRYDTLSRMPAPVIVANQANPGDLVTLRAITSGKEAAQADKSRAVMIMGFGIIIVGAVGLVYSRIPDQPPAVNVSGSAKSA